MGFLGERGSIKVASCKVLTLFLTKDVSTFNYSNYIRILKQNDIEQDVYVISAESIPVKNNIVIKVPQHLPVPLRIGLSINAALKRFDLSKYLYIFKIDGDVKLPLDYCKNLLEKRAPVAGRGAALLISTEFFIKILKGKYPLNYCDDGYISALSIAAGYWPPEYTGKGSLVIPILRQCSREFGYGYEYYKWGLPFAFFVISVPFLLIFGKKDLRSIIYNTAGYVSAFLHKEERYKWWRNYMYFRLQHTLIRVILIIKKVGVKFLY